MLRQGLIVVKQEMTRLWVDGKYQAVTLVKMPIQEVVRKKTQDRDGYEAVLLGANKKELNKEKGQKVSYGYQFEVRTAVWDDFSHEINIWDVVSVVGTSQWKGFQWVMKRHNFWWGPATHGSKFHRAWGSTGTRKPRRTIRWRKMAGRMGTDRITLKKRAVLDMRNDNGETFYAIKWSLPGSYNSYLQVTV